MSSRLCAMALGLLAVGGAGCADETALEGSLGEVVDLRFETVELAATESAVILSYRRRQGEGRDTVLKLAVDVPPGNVVPGVDVNLGPGMDGEPRATLSRSVSGEGIATFAAIVRGSLRLEQRPAVGQPCAGEWRVTLGEGGDAGRGRTVFGHFTVGQVVAGDQETPR